MEVLFEARAGGGIGDSSLTDGFSGSSSLLSDVEQKTESEKCGILAQLALAEPIPGASERARGYGSTGKAGEFTEVVTMLDLRPNGGRTLPICRGLRSSVMTGWGGSACIPGTENALRSRGRCCDDEVGEPISEAGRTGVSDVMDGLSWI